VAVRQGATIAVPMTFLSFSRGYEAEADYLGLQYMYATGYDPTAVISVFEKLDALNRRKPGSVSRLFSTHPMDADRIRKAQKEIQEILPARDQYVVNTSEYHDMRQRVFVREAHQKSEPRDNRPTLLKPLEIGPHEN
jgi:predicted Zn-dependent protease